MASRRQARRRALDILYQSDVTGADPVEVVDAWAVAGHRVDPFARDLVEGVAISVIVLGLVAGDNLPLSIVAIVQVVVLLLIYAATFSRG